MDRYKENISHFTKRLYRLLRHKPEIFKIRKLRGARGWCFDDIDLIELDYRDEMISTLVHETLHYIHPDWSETKVLEGERWIMNNLSPVQVKNILKRFVAIL